ncbi:MAG: T9SS type A sorting domain-containing protein [Ignavibacteria bacterium]|nr:T9SS type A sorting domain-containing protein [Ignavibacteria bacterium]
MKRITFVTFFWLMLLMGLDVFAQTTLAAGDIAVVGAWSDKTGTNAKDNAFAIVLLKSITAGTAFTVTDRGWYTPGSSFYNFTATSELNYVFTAPQNLLAGTVLYWYGIGNSSNSSGWTTPGATGQNLSNLADQLIIYQGTESSPTFIYAFNWGTTGFITSGTLNSTTSYLPSTLTLGVNAMEWKVRMFNSAYTGPLSGNLNTLRTNIMNSAYWTYESTLGSGVYPSFPASPMPVELSSFSVTAKNGSALVNWVTASEVNNAGFYIERKRLTDANEGPVVKEWEQLGFVKGYGYTNEKHDYSYSDVNPGVGTFQYRLHQIDNDGRENYLRVAQVTFKPGASRLDQNFPNPFNPSTKISYYISHDDLVVLKIYNVLGKEVATLVNTYQQAGTHYVDFRPELASGMYYYKITAGNFSEIKKMLYIK